MPAAWLPAFSFLSAKADIKFGVKSMYDLIIVGAGPAGLTAAIYAKRAELNTLLIERYGAGGQINNTYEVDNYPGFPGISGFDLGQKMSEHVDKFECERMLCEVEALDLTSDIKVVKTDEGDFEAKAIILASGNSPRHLDIPGEEELTGSGVSYCATCDGAFFRNKEVAVIGGGDVAVEDAIFLSRGCSKVYLLHRRDELRAAKSLQSALLKLPNVEVLWDSIPVTINGEDVVASVSARNVKTGEDFEIPVSGVFIAVGNNPNAAYINGLEVDKAGFVIAGEDCCTNIPGVFVAGDLRSKSLRQVSTAVADGANAVYSVQNYLSI